MKSPEKITVLITEDHALIREAWSGLLRESRDFQVVSECCTAEEAIEAAQKLQPNIIMMDLNLPGINGVEATEIIMKLLPDTKILGVSFHAQPAYAMKMMKAGALGYITKNSTVRELFQALAEIADQKKYICEEVKELISDNFLAEDSPYTQLKSLSPRESEIVSLIHKGYSSKQIAETLSISMSTVSAHRYNIFKKLKITKTAKLITLVNKYQYVA